jgi:glucose-1-phosphate thymidylyltransferase
MELKALLRQELRILGLLLVPETGEEVKAITGEGERFGAKILLISLQEEPAGLAHAVKIAQTFLEDSPFIMYLGDNLIEKSPQTLFRDFSNRIN